MAAVPADDDPFGVGARRQPGFHSGALRKQDDARWLGLGGAALVAMLLPVSPAAEGGLYLWDLWPVATGFETLRLLAPALLGLTLLGVSAAPRVTRLGQSIAVLVAVLVLAPLHASSELGFEQTFGGLLDFVGRHPLATVGGMAVVAAGADLHGGSGELLTSRATRTTGRWMLAVGSVLLWLGCLLPYRGEPELWRLARHAWVAARVGGARLLAGQAMLLLLGSLPLWIAVGGLLALRPPPRPRIWLTLTARYGLSVLAILLGLRLLVAQRTSTDALMSIRTALLLAVAIASTASALVGLTRHVLDAPLPPVAPASTLTRDVRLRELLRAYQQAAQSPAERPSSVLRATHLRRSHPWLEWLMRRRLVELATDCRPPPTDPLRPSRGAAKTMLEQLSGHGASGGAEPQRSAGAHSVEPAGAAGWLTRGARRLTWGLGLGIVAYGGWLGWLARKPPPELEWTLAPAPSGAEELFSSALPRYVVALAQSGTAGGDRVARQSAADRLLDQQRALLATSARLDAELATRFDHLFRVADRVDRTGQLWLSAVHEVNRRVRALGWPYYVDGNVLQFASRSAGASRRLFYVTTYRVERLRRFAVDGHPFAALHARRLDRLNIIGARLGAVRRDEPFALVMLSMIEQSARARVVGLRAAHGCGFGRNRISSGLDDPLAAIDVDDLCGGLQIELLADRGLSLDDDDVESLVVRLQVDATERHEIQHQADGEQLVVPSELLALAPWASGEQLVRMAQELSASLAELGSNDSLALTLQLADLTAHLLERSRGSPYRYAAAVVIGRLHGRPVLDDDGHVNTSELRRFWTALAAHRTALGAMLGPRAREAHLELFGTAVAVDSPEG